MDHTTVKAEAGKGGSSSEVVPNGGIRDGSQETSKKKAVEGLDGSQETSKKKVVEGSDVGSKDTNWTEEEFALSIDYFAKECLLPSDGMLANDVPRTLVSDEDIERCFGPRLGQKGRNGPKINNCTGLPQAEVLHLFQVIDGHDKPVNGTLGVIFPRALYAERFLKKRINWAAYAHEKHKNQIRTCKGRGDSRPTAIEASRISLKSAEETISNAETRYREECDVRDKLEHNRAALAEKKQALEIRLEDGGFDEENPEDMKLLQKLELQEEELVLTYSAALTALEESNKRLKDLQTDLKLGRTSAEKMNAEITTAEVQILTSQSAITREESTVVA
ncbi:hypothetical protein R1sor_015194 [Riccia sorocarpa]|uniref:Uncharacterized protein n=1 Tax=Riccia sorocarpa TaxID=122646 RepID=A0ABD3HEV3_9MARC